MYKIFNLIKRDTNQWSILLLTIVLLVTIPIAVIFFKLFEGPGEIWQHMLENLIPTYLQNSLILIVGCGFFTFVLGVSSAWIMARYYVPFRKQLQWLLILPLAVPSYITAYAYAGIFDYGGWVETLFFKLNIMNTQGLIFVLSVSLYPYVYLSSRAFFQNQSNNIIEASKLLGAGEVKTFFRLILPLGRPAIVGGLVLVLMEVLNDYGAAKYYGINTFTTGIFRAWFSLEEPQTAIYLAALLVVFIFGLLYLEKRQRRKKGYFNAVRNHQKIAKQRMSTPVQIVLFVIVFFPVFFGFLLPVFQLIYWVFLTFEDVFSIDFLHISLQSLLVALLTAFCTVSIALMLILLSRWNRLSYLKSVTKVSVLGYAIPGAVIAVGVLIPTLAFDKWLVSFYKEYFDLKIGFVINGTIIALVYAYVIRFLAVAHNPIEASSLKNGKSLFEASKLLGKGNIATFVKVEFPLLRSAIIAAFILVFVDVMKELPLTLILKPYQLQTLAVKAYEYASDEMIAEASLPSLFIVITGVIPVLLLNKILQKDE